tara:strand:+ start:690 stop:1079 length:390 start_codon:yes stop_codon:yes gene_type:complete
MNKHIQLVEKWLDDKDSVTQEELEQNKEDARAAYADARAASNAADDAYFAARKKENSLRTFLFRKLFYANAAYTAYYADTDAAADAASDAVDDAYFADFAAYFAATYPNLDANAAYWVKEYYKLTGERK